MMLSVFPSVYRNIENGWRVTWWQDDMDDMDDIDDMDDMMIGSFAHDKPYGIFKTEV